MNQCKHLKPDGRRCKHVSNDSSHCWQHHTANKEKKVSSKFQQRGGTSTQLSTITNLSEKNVEKITAAINPLIADAFSLYLKSKNFHWHLFGKHFRDLHLLFDEHADDIFATIDVLAERVRKLGGSTIKSIGHIARLKTISDDDDELVSSDQMVQRLLQDNFEMAKAQRAAIDLCEKAGDTPTANILQEFLDKTERRVWFLFELNQNGS